MKCGDIVQVNFKGIQRHGVVVQISGRLCRVKIVGDREPSYGYEARHVRLETDQVVIHNVKMNQSPNGWVDEWRFEDLKHKLWPAL